ncbi:hypothetical protein MuYL_3947 [Mucilaginibacter xinganensis]|uniref:Uncharacterized protein n=1 Tax=Mucilaginibacter xinganensis TaxID=1234841 RepID=A0A223P143_9SPHI|nr:hypothetical protein MuYL_3947 [Mucilaginibacter xinganensis]
MIRRNKWNKRNKNKPAATDTIPNPSPTLFAQQRGSPGEDQAG